MQGKGENYIGNADSYLCLFDSRKLEEEYLLNCPNCGRQLEENVSFCDMCGKKVEQQAPPRFCQSCGTKIDEAASFCPSCGAKRPEATQTTQSEPAKPAADTIPTTDILAYIDNSIRSQSKFFTAQDYINGTKPFSSFWAWLLGITLLAFFVGGDNGPIFAFFSLLFGFAVIMVVCAIQEYQLSRQAYPLSKEIEIPELGSFLKNNLSCYGFTDWQYGVPTFVGIKDTTRLVICFSFEKKTTHTISLPNNEGVYRIDAQETTRSKLLLGRNPMRCYRNDKRIRPILVAAMEYYLGQN